MKLKQLLLRWIKLLQTSGINSKRIVLEEMKEYLETIKE